MKVCYNKNVREGCCLEKTANWFGLEFSFQFESFGRLNFEIYCGLTEALLLFEVDTVVWDSLIEAQE